MALANMLTDTKIVRVLNAVAAGVTQQTTTPVNTTGYDGIMFVCLLNTVVSTCALSLQLQDAAAQGGPFTNVTGAPNPSAIAGAASSNLLLAADCAVSPLKAWVQCLVNRTVANATLDGVLAILYRAKQKPTPLDATMLAAAFGEAQS
jgi:hypothetical protein